MIIAMQPEELEKNLIGKITGSCILNNSYIGIFQLKALLRQENRYIIA
jgi:hypothetical protein